MMASNSPFSMAFTTVSVIPAADISGLRSYVATLGDGTRILSSPPNGFSTPPLKKYVTCAYFSVSAVRRFLYCSSAKTCARMCSSFSGAITNFSNGQFLSYCVIPTYDKFIRNVRFVAPLQRRNWIICARFRFAVNQRAIGQFDALPAVVAVHRVVAPYQRSDFADAQLAHLLLQLPDVIASAVRRRVAPVHKTVHKHFFHILLFGHLQQRKQMLNVRVHSAVAEQSEEMQLP